MLATVSHRASDGPVLEFRLGVQLGLGRRRRGAAAAPAHGPGFDS